MSKTLVCLQKTLPFYGQEKITESHLKYEESSTPQSADCVLNCVDDMSPLQDENNYVQCSVQKQMFSRKREASNILMECVKRRDNLRNIDADNVPLSDYCRLSFLTSPKNCKLADPSAEDSGTDSGVESLSKKSSPCHSMDTLSRTSFEEESCKSGVENVEPGSKVSPSNPEHSGGSSPPIHRDLCSLHLTDELPRVQESPGQNAGKLPVTPSLFKSVSSTLYFVAQEDTVQELPCRLLQYMKWKLSSITPTLIREMVLKNGFLLVEADTKEDWVGTWGKHLKCALFKDIKHFQRVNHYPGSFHLGRKDKLWGNIKRLRNKHGPEAYNFFPETFLLPADMKCLKRIWDAEADKLWIIKPPASARGTGVKVIHKWVQVPKKRPVVVQRYLGDPYLINGTKFDLRLYVLIPSMEPLRIYVFEDGLVRFASEKYSLSNKTFSNRFIHLTNYSINRKSSTYTSNEDENSCHGHKWTLKSFWSYMSNSGIDVSKIKESITDTIIKTVISSESPMLRLIRTYARSTYNCFELFGFDVMLDKNLRPWLLEVNISPSLHTRSLLDSHVKGNLVRDMFNLVGFQIPENLLHISEHIHEEYGITSKAASQHKSLKHRSLSPAERRKHSLHTFEHPDGKCDILESLTSDDVRCLIESEDEYRRRGSFVRVFPTHQSSRYFQYFEHTRYYNLLLDAWEKHFHDRREEGIQRLQALCAADFHLQFSLDEEITSV